MITDYQRKGRADNCCARNREATEKVKPKQKSCGLATGVEVKDTRFAAAAAVLRPTTAARRRTTGTP